MAQPTLRPPPGAPLRVPTPGVMELWNRLCNVAVVAADSHDARVQKRLQVGMAAASVGVVFLWGMSFVIAGRLDLAVYIG